MKKGLGHEYPLYNPYKGGGAITIGANSYNTTITLTENYFSDNKKDYDGNGFGQNIDEWLDISSHEVKHIKHIGESNSIIKYLFRFGLNYFKYGHDSTPEEIDAEKSRTKYRDFTNYLDKNFEKGCLQQLFNENMTDGQKIKQIDDWWKEYEKEK